jgi:hypothetical protein
MLDSRDDGGASVAMESAAVENPAPALAPSRRPEARTVEREKGWEPLAARGPLKRPGAMRVLSRNWMPRAYAAYKFRNKKIVA